MGAGRDQRLIAPVTLVAAVVDVGGMNTPDATPLQLGAVAAFGAAVAAAGQAGLKDTTMLVFMIVTGAITVTLIIADAVIRRGRATYAAAVELADARVVAAHPAPPVFGNDPAGVTSAQVEG